MGLGNFGAKPSISTQWSTLLVVQLAKLRGRVAEHIPLPK